MKLSLSTNWCNRRIESGEEIAEKALELGFDELELGFRTRGESVPGFRRMLDRIPVGSVHAFCPVPLSAPYGHPELYTLASFDDEARAMARFQVKRSVEFAADIGADVVVLHAGRIAFDTVFRRGFSSQTLTAARRNVDAGDAKYAKLLARARKVRDARAAKMMDVFRAELDALVPVLERNRVTLALENLPYLEAFPDESEMAKLRAALGDVPVKAWFDTGHHRVREMHGWLAKDFERIPAESEFRDIAGMHLNDVEDFCDDHLPPGEGKVDFAALKPLARSVGHVVFEPNSSVREEALSKGLALIRGIWES